MAVHPRDLSKCIEEKKADTQISKCNYSEEWKE
jgi:hypothetical protein